MGERFVKTPDIKNAVKGREAEVLVALGIAWERGRPHIDCPYPTHGGKLDWRWEPKEAKAFCTCSTKGDSIFDVVSKVESLGDGKTGFEAAKLRVAKILGRADLIQEPGVSTGSTTADRLLNRPAAEQNDSLPATYLAARLGVAVADLVQPSTRTVGLRELGYYDPPAIDGGKPHLVGKFPCAVFETVAADGKKHAHRIYLAADGKAKAALGKRADGEERDLKKAAKRLEGDTISGRSVLFGDAGKAEHLVVAEGIETAAAVAYAFKAEVQAGAVAVAAAISAVGVEAVKPWPGTERIAVAADRDEAMKGLCPGTRRGEQAARVLAARLIGVVPVSMALPGEAGQSVDWLDILRTNGADQVRAGLLGAELVVPSADDLAASGQQRTAKRKAKLEVYAEAYPLPELHGLRLALRTTYAGKVKLHRITETTEPKTGEVQEKAVPVATPFGVKALLRYADKADAYGLRVVVEDMKGNPRAVDFARSALARMGANDIKAELFAAGLRVEGKGDDYAVQALKAADPTEEIVVVSRPGWHTLPPHAEPVFIAPSGVVVGTAPVQVELAMGNRQVAPLQAGTMDGWKEAAAAALGAPGVPHWTLGIAAGFAGVLVSLTGLDTCGINLSGMSSAGKTAAQRLAVSVWSSVGIGVGLLQSMRSTENAVEALAQNASGTILALDEMAHADGKAVGKLIYSVAGGVGKSRMTSGAQMRGRYTWQTFALLSGECSLEEKVRGDGGQWMAGMAVRFADIDITRVNRSVPAETLATIAGIERHYGHAGPAFVSALVEGGFHAAPDRIRDQVLAAARKIAGDKADSACIRAAQPFALLYVAGELARKFGIIPETAEIGKAVTWAWQRFHASTDVLSLDPEAQAIENLQRWIAERWGVSVIATTAQAESKAAGRLVEAWHDDTAVYIPTARIREAAGNALKETHIAKLLDSRGLLAKRDSAERLAVRYVPRVGHVQAYALSVSEFGRSDSDAPRFEVVGE